VLIGKNADGLVAIAVLPLPSRLLRKFVRYLKHGLFMAKNESHAIAICEVALVVRRNAAGGCLVGIVVQHRRIKIAFGNSAFGTDAQSVLAPALRAL
jgi:hypothetical protein